LSDPMADVGVVLAAAGSGTRFGTRKQYLEIGGRPLIHASLDVFAQVKAVVEAVVVCPPSDRQVVTDLVAEWSFPARPKALPVRVVGGGERRQDSVLRGIEACGEAIVWVLVHDVARPLVEVEHVDEVVRAMRSHGAAVLGIPCHDSVKRVREGRIVEELPREEVWTVQTPQGGRCDVLREAYSASSAQDWTDEASALRHRGVTVALVEGSPDNIKITRPGDEARAARILAARNGR